MNGNGDEMNFDELKTCPLCGSKAEQSFAGGKNVQCSNSDCQLSIAMIYPRFWNTRPIEDALRAQLATRDALIERLVEAGNDIVEEAQVQEPDVQELRDNWRVLIAEWEASKDGGRE